MRDAIDQYYADKGKYPSGLEELASAGYIRRLPIDPITNSTSTWQPVPAEPDPNNPTARSASPTSRAAPRARRSTDPSTTSGRGTERRIRQVQVLR